MENQFKPSVEWTPANKQAAERIVNAIVAWNNGLLKVGRTPAEDVPLPWYWKFVAWAGRKCGIGLLQIVGFQMTISHYKRRIMTALWS
jgi:hypothetical protein